MASIFLEQIDYIYFVCGASFGLLSIIGFLLFSLDKNKKFWKWLGLFGAFYAINEWLDLAAFSLGDHYLFQLVRLGFLTVSLICFLEACLSCIYFQSGKNPVQWFFIPFVLFFLLGWRLEGLNGANVFFRYILGVVCGVGAVYILLASKDANKRMVVNGRLGWFAAVLGVYALTQAVAPEARFFPASVLNYDSFLQTFGFPIQLLRTCLVLSASFFLWFYYKSLDKYFVVSKNPKELYIPLIIFLLIVTAGWAGTEAIGRYYKNNFNDGLLINARIVTAGINPLRINALTGSIDDLNSEDYIRLKEQLYQINRATPDQRFVYLLGARGKTIFFYADSEPKNSSDYSAPGDIYHNPPLALMECFLNGKSLVVGPFKDQWGKWISAFVPLRDLQSTEILAVLGMDTDFGKWMRYVFSHRLFGIIITLGAMFLICSFFVIFQLKAIANRELSRSKEFLGKIINSVVDPIFVKDRGHKFILVNNSFCLFLGRLESDVIGKSDSDFFPKSQVEVFLKKDEEVFLSGRENTNEEFFTDTQGQTSVIVTKKGLYTDSMGNKFIVGVIRDITEHKKAQEYLKEANKKLQELDQRKSDFVDNVSHEFRNPLSIIKESLGLILDRIVGDINPKQEDLILTARSNINRLIRLVADLLDIAKIESGKMSLVREQVDIIKLVKEIVSGYALEIAKKQLIYKEDIQPDVGFIWADRDKLTEVVINLLNNAIKYTSCGGAITLKLSGTNEQVRFEVSDTGSGIPKEYVDKIFDKFERIASERQEGTGLGLPIAKGIVELHGGKIWVESQPGQGSSFIVVLPRDLRKDG